MAIQQNGLFIGLTTLDCIYLAQNPPQANQKIVAIAATNSAGGPATNAAVAFSYLGNQSTLLSVVGQHPMTTLIKSDLESCGVAIADLDPTRMDSPPVSSIVVTQSTGERAVISLNSTNLQANPNQIPVDILDKKNVVLIDGHQMAVAKAIVPQAKAKNIPIMIDAGSWKPGFEAVLSWADYVICSANFHPPNCHTIKETFAYLTQLEIPNIAITQGQAPILYSHQGDLGSIPITPVKTVDTLGAGDIFHGAFCHYILQTNFVNALTQASAIASHSCQFFGTREWMKSS